MDWKTVSSFFEITHQLRRRQFFLWSAAVVILLPTLLTHFFFWRIEHRLKLKIHRKPIVFLVPGVIHINGPFLEWPNRLYVRSGDLTIQYPCWAIFQNKVPLSLNGHNLEVEAGPELLHSLGQETIVFDRVTANLVIDGKRIDIDSLDAESKTVQFHLKKLPQPQK